MTSRVNSFQALVSAIDREYDFALRRYPHIGIILKHELSVVGQHTPPADAGLSGKLFAHDPTFIQYAALKGKTKALLELIKIAREQGLSLEQILEPKTSNTKISVINLVVHSGNATCLKELLKYLNSNEERIATVDGLTDSDRLESPLLAAINSGSSKMVSILVNECGADPLWKSDIITCPLIKVFQLAKEKKDGPFVEMRNIMYEWMKKPEIFQSLQKLRWTCNLRTDSQGESDLREALLVADFRQEHDDVASIWDVEIIKDKNLKEEEEPSPSPQVASPHETAQDQTCEENNCSELAGNICPKCDKHLCDSHIESHDCVSDDDSSDDDDDYL